MSFTWKCNGCGETGKLREDFICPHCAEPRSLTASLPEDTHFLDTPPASLWHYAPLLPIKNPEHAVSLGEGATPLVTAPKLAAHFGLGEIRLKNETTNPTGSFKDRQVSVGITHAREIGIDTVAVVSSGNVACAASAYAARAGMRAVLFMHGQAGRGKIAQAGVYGAKVLCIDSPSPNEVFQLCMEACEAWGWYHLSTAGIYEAYNVEGAKTIAYELYHQYKGDLPDWLVAPVGGGGLLGGIWRGFEDLKRMGRIDRIPRLAGVQATGCAPLCEAIEKGWTLEESLKHPWPDPETVAGGIADDILFDGHTVLPALRETDGVALAVTDPDIEAGMRLLAETEGLLCELTSSVVMPAIAQLPDTDDSTRICVMVTGSGIKEIPYLTENASTPEPIPCSLDAVAAVTGT